MTTRPNLERLAEQLIDTAEVAQILGLAGPRQVSVYQKRYRDMPRPIVDRGKNRVKLWYKPEIMKWNEMRGKG